MENSEKFCLKWNSFQDNIVDSFKSLRHGEDFSDVTLVSEDHKHIEAHRVVISSCSSFFRDLLKKDKHSHPLIYMRGIKAKELLAMVDYMYHGQVNVYQEDLSVFLITAEELKLTGLVESSNQITEDIRQKNTNQKVNIKEERHDSPPPLEVIQSPIIPNTSSPSIVTSPTAFANCITENELMREIQYDEATHSSFVSVNGYEELDAKISVMMVKVDRKWTCRLCGKADIQKMNIKNHIEGKHIEGISHPCHMCGSSSRSRNALRLHIAKQHGNQETLRKQQQKDVTDSSMFAIEGPAENQMEIFFEDEASDGW